MDFDTILKDVGEFGRFQKLLIPLIILPACLPGGFHGFSQIFTLGVPDRYNCRIPGIEHLNLTQAETESLLPWDTGDNGQYGPSNCKLFDFNYSSLQPGFNVSQIKQSNRTVSCTHGWVYDKSAYTSTLGMEWNLVCDNQIYATLATELNTIGTLVGSFVFGYLADQLGRKKTYMIAILLQLITGVLTAFAWEYYTFCFIRFLNGTTIAPSWILPLIMGLEIISPDARAPVGISMSVFYSLGVIILSGIAYGIRDWFYLQFAVSLPFVVFVAFWWILPESPRWLISQGRLKETIRIVRKIASFNNVDLSEQYYNNVRQMFRFSIASGRIVIRKYYVLDLFQTPNLRRKTIIVVFNSFANYAVYNGLMFFGSGFLGSSPQLNMLYSALVDLPAYALLYVTLNRCGRKPILVCFMVMSGLLCIATASVNIDTHKNTVTSLFLLSKFCITCSYFVSDLMASELFPTVVRGAGASLTQMSAAAGLCIVPMVNFFSTSQSHVPLFVYGSFAMVGGITATLLPETKDQLLPDSLEEGELFGRYSTWFDILFASRRTRRVDSYATSSVDDEFNEEAWYSKDAEDDRRMTYAKEESSSSGESDADLEKKELSVDQENKEAPQELKLTELVFQDGIIAKDLLDPKRKDYTSNDHVNQIRRSISETMPEAIGEPDEVPKEPDKKEDDESIATFFITDVPT